MCVAMILPPGIMAGFLFACGLKNRPRRGEKMNLPTKGREEKKMT